jgi:phosphopantothenoylcysteine decarboxylase/phosphopantothenate--cysteine ligase
MKNILLGVTGGIAAFKAAQLASRLRQGGFEVQVVMTKAATEFVTPLTFRELTGQVVHLEQFAEPKNWQMEHISLARWADLFVIAPATANIIGKLAHGIADDLLTTVALATTAPLLVAPAMNSQMYLHPATAANLTILKERGVQFVGPARGHLACGEEGVGRMAPVAQIQERIVGLLSPQVLSGKKVLVTAGPTREAIDPFRFISNYSTGRMGYAIAQVASQMGAEVILVSGPTQLPAPFGVERIMVESASQMKKAVLAHFDEVQVVVKAAAVSDWQSITYSEQKLKKDQREELCLKLVPTSDILAELGQRKNGQFIVGFAAESENLEHYATGKLQSKGCDMIVANPIGRADAGFASETNQVTIITQDSQDKWPLLGKDEVAKRLWLRIAKELEGRSS